MRVERISINRIHPSPLNSRIAPNSDDLDSLVASIKRMGLIQPIKVRPVEDNYEIVTGERRFNALRKAGILYVEAIVEEMTDEEVLREQWDENNERQDLSDYERALALKKMLEVYGCTQARLAERMGNDQSWISRHLAILKLEEFMPIGIIRELKESQARAIFQASKADWLALVQYVELYREERGEIPSASAIEEYAGELALATEFAKSRRRLLYEIEGEPAVETSGPTESEEEGPEETDLAYIEEPGLGWVFDAEANGAGFLTKISTLTTEQLEFCLAHETRPLNLQRLNEEMNGRVPAQAPRPLLKEPPTTSAQVISFITERIGEPVEEIQAKLVEEHELNEEEAQAALQAYRETYPDIWDRCYKQPSEEEEPLTAEKYVTDILHHNPEVKHADLIKATVSMFDDVTEPYIQGLIDRRRKRRDIYATKSPTTLCPLCGRANAQKNRILMVLEEYQATQPGVTLVDWLKEVLA